MPKVLTAEYDRDELEPLLHWDCGEMSVLESSVRLRQTEWAMRLNNSIQMQDGAAFIYQARVLECDWMLARIAELREPSHAAQ